MKTKGNGLRDKYRKEHKEAKLAKKQLGWLPKIVIFMGVDALESVSGTVYQPLKTGWRKLGKRAS